MKEQRERERVLLSNFVLFVLFVAKHSSFWFASLRLCRNPTSSLAFRLHK
jgi:hypothetical protein